ncbi:TPR_REGION domain-containing protein [Meloidogyne graminicola]|uniref:Transcription initiation factor TFIID subunit 12 n=1 Tax=Meloidogyne graminicola TaxID=189291 RepID=A0A8S9ZZT4_9BILA|nr:TPR_REGION domain-containing protein [Meloidogyne graminicola]
MKDNDENRPNTYLDDLMRRINPNTLLENDLHDILIEFTNNYVNEVLNKACSLAKHRGSKKLTKDDVNFVLALFASSHLIFNSKDGKYEEEDSLYLIRHPYLLNDFYNQIEWIKELLELKTTVRQQKILINKKYDYDDIEIEQKIRTTDDDCIRSRNFDPKKNQHINLAIERVDQLDDFINSNRAPITARLQSKLAYEYFEYGENFNCKEIIRNDGKKERKRLVCNVTDWEIYNELLNKQKEKKVEIIQQELLELNFINNERLNRKENDEKIEKKRNSELKEYKNKLKNFIKNIGKLMENGPQFIPKYPILNKPNKELFEFFHPSWPSIQKCNEFINEIIFEKENYLNNLRLPELFISPENKGFLISDLLTKYLLIENNQLTPLPWKLPYCSPYINKTLLFDEKLNFIENLNIFKKLKSGYFEPSDKFAEKRLKNELFKLIGYNLNINKLNEQQLEQQQQPLIREIGQRIGNLIEFDIGPRWITFNLAALYFRYIGIPKEAIICLEEALKYSKYEDIALTQLAQIILRLNNSINDKNNGLEKIISLSMHLGLNEPIPFNLMAIFYQLKGNSFNSEKYLFQAMELDYNFKPSLNILLNKKCSQRIINSKQTSFLKFNNIYSSPICCWPNEQNIYCFKTINKNKKIIINCYKLEEYLFNNNNFNLIYFRCNNTPYKGKSYPIPGFVNLIIPFLFPIVKLREIKDNIFSKKLEEEFEQKLTKENKIIKEIPVFPLDYGGYSIERINAYQRPIWPEGVQEQINQFEINFNLNEEENKYLNKIKEEKQQINEKNNLINKKEQFINSFSFKQSNIFNNNNQINENLLKKVLYNFDISLPKKLPIPSIYMVNKGKEIFSFSLTSLKEICQKKLLNNLLFEQPISTWVSPSAKGINVYLFIYFFF